MWLDENIIGAKVTSFFLVGSSSSEGFSGFVACRASRERGKFLNL